MKVIIFTAEDGPETREAKDFGLNLTQEDYEVEYLDRDDENAINLINLYDVYSYPTFVVAREDGSQVECWRGKIPLASDIKIFLNQ
jgi:hypothetical protein